MATARTWEPPKLDLSVDRYAAFKAWKDRWTDYSVVTKLTAEAAEYQCSMLRYTFTEDTRKIYNTLQLTDEEIKNPDTIITKLETFAKGTVNETMERHSFNTRKQEEGELFDDFLTDLKILSKNCNFCVICHDGLVRDRIVAGIGDSAVRRKLLSDTKLDLKKAEDICRANEKAKQGIELFKDETVGNRENDIAELTDKSRRMKMQYSNHENQNNRDRNRKYPSNNAGSRRNQSPKDPLCKFCVKHHRWGRQFCPAWEKKCMACGQRNHSPESAICKRNTSIGKVEDEQNRDEALADYLFLGAVDSIDEEEQQKIIDSMSWEVHMPAKEGTIRFKLDTGADVTIIPKEELCKLGLDETNIIPTNKKLFGPGKQRIRCLGYVKTKFTWGEITDQQIVYVCAGVQRALLGKPAIIKLKIMQMNETEKYSCGAVNSDPRQPQDEEPKQDVNPLVKEFPSIHGRLGKIEAGEDVHIQMKKNVTPHQVTSPRHIPIPLRNKVIAELNKMIELQVIRKIDKPTEWCHPIVVVSKPNGEIRLCIDLTKLNSGIQRELYQLESVEETIAKLGDECVYMTKVDANSGYWQVPLDEESQELTTFITPIGRFCCTRGPYGLCSMQEIFSKKMDIVIEGIEGVAKSTDDFLIYAMTLELLKVRTRRLFERFEQYGVTINLKKCIFEKTEMDFLGYKITKDGIQPLESKMAAIRDFKQPENITELRRFMGMANQMGKFNPNLAEASSPLRDLLSSKNEWLWTETHTAALEAVKRVLQEPETLKLYDVSKPTKIRCDGSKLNGIAVILYQQHEDEKWFPVTCASRYLKPEEKNYYPIENECLAVQWGCERMNLYLQGLPHFTVETDHNPLIPILNSKSLIEMSPRIQAMRMKLMKYSFTAQHVKGKDMADADALSRAPHENPTEADEVALDEVSCHVAAVIQSMPVTAQYFDKIKEETKQDKTLQQVIKIMQNGWPNSKKECNKELQRYWASRHDLAVIRNVLVKGNRIIIPTALRKEVLQKLHNGHQGIDRSKRMARHTCYWPNMNDDIEKMVQHCKECLRYKPSKQVDTLQPHPVPTRPWEKIGSDLFHIGDKDYIVITDYYSLWPEVYELQDITSQPVINVMKDVFSRHGVPTQLVSDNGPQYSSHKFRRFAREWEFEHITSSPRYPKSNGLAESSVKTVKTLIKKCLASGTDIKKGLLAIRNTPLRCGSSPAQLLMNRQLNDNLPRLQIFNDTKKTHRRDLVTEREEQKRQHDKGIHHQQRCTNTFHPGQLVAVQDYESNEWSLRGRISKEVAPRSYLIDLGNQRMLRRNQQHIRKIQSTASSWVDKTPQDMYESPDEEDYDDESDVSEAETVPYEEEDHLPIFQEEDVRRVTTRSGRMVKEKIPTDYEDL